MKHPWSGNMFRSVSKTGMLVLIWGMSGKEQYPEILLPALLQLHHRAPMLQ